MNYLFSTGLAEAFGWALIHSLWQGFLIVVLLSLILGLVKGLSSHFRYGLSLLALLSMLIWTGITFTHELLQPSQESDVARTVGLQITENGITSVTIVQMSSFVWLEEWKEASKPYIPLLFVSWMIGVVIFGLRWVGSWAYVYRLRTQDVVELEYFWHSKLNKLATQMGIDRTIKLLESSRVGSPMVIGHLKPVILLPIGLLSGISPAQLEAILAHELAHIRRYDFLINIVQSWIEILFFYHPAYWWLSTKIQDEREHACDDIAVAICGDPIIYAKALAELEECKQAHAAGLAMALQGRKNHLLYRIKRLIMPKTTVKHSKSKVLLTALLLVGFLGASWMYPRFANANDISPLSSPEPVFMNPSELAIIQMPTDTPPPKLKPLMDVPPIPSVPPVLENFSIPPMPEVPPFPEMPAIPFFMDGDSIDKPSFEQFKMDMKVFEGEQKDWEIEMEKSMEAFKFDMKAFEEAQSGMEDQIKESMKSYEKAMKMWKEQSFGLAQKKELESYLWSLKLLKDVDQVKQMSRFEEMRMKLEALKKLQGIGRKNYDKEELLRDYEEARKMQVQDLEKELKSLQKLKEGAQKKHEKQQLLRKHDQAKQEQLRKLKMELETQRIQLDRELSEVALEREAEINEKRLLMRERELALHKELEHVKRNVKARFEKLKKSLWKELISDDIIGKNQTKVRIKIQNSVMKVNGKKLTESQTRKYKKLLRASGLLHGDGSNGTLQININ